MTVILQQNSIRGAIQRASSQAISLGLLNSAQAHYISNLSRGSIDALSEGIFLIVYVLIPLL
jgi:hypothetical protein